MWMGVPEGKWYLMNIKARQLVFVNDWEVETCGEGTKFITHWSKDGHFLITLPCGKKLKTISLIKGRIYY